jgi:hypothetical protein
MGDNFVDRFWEDLRFPAQGINPTGSAAPPGTGEDGTLLFRGSVGVEIVAGVAQMPHGWDEGTTISPHVHWSKTTSAAGGVVWQFRYRIASVGDTLTDWSDWADGTDEVGPTDVAYTHSLASFPDLDMTGFGISCMILWQLQRDPLAAGDTYGADAALWEFDIHYQQDQPGSRREFLKD